MSQPDFSNIHPSLKSGLTGGAATGIGVDYQTQYAVYVALKLIVRLLRDSPIQRPMLVIEPRILSDGTLTRWDLRVAPDGVATEVKAKPTKSDLVELLNRCRTDVESGRSERFELVYAECTIGFLKAIGKLIRLAVESAGNEESFQKLCELEMDDRLQKVLEILGPTALVVGQRLILKPHPAHVLDDAIDVHLQFLVSPPQLKNLKVSLFSTFVSAMKERETFFIPALIKKLRDEGVEIVDPGTILPTDIDPILHKALFLMQRSVVGLPIEVLAECTGCQAPELAEMFQHTQAAAVGPNRICTPNPIPAKLDHANAGQLLADGLSAVIEYIKANKTNENGLQQVENAIALVRECSTANPEAATTAFGPLDKLLKRSGQKRRVLEMAQITIDSARAHSPSTEAVRREEAKALICGLSWVYQRTGRLNEAESSAAESLQIGESLNWHRNTAFCLKCIGRLRRVRAEQELHPKRQTKLLGESRDHLLKAIDVFSSCLEFGPHDPEVGDCYSLLARTYLLAGRSHDADQCATRARELITSSPGYTESKDFMDLLILEGELLTAQLDYAGADEKFIAALNRLNPKDAEKSEIAARAYLARGVNLSRWKRDKDAAVAEIRKAAVMWEKLNEHFYRGLAEWAIIDIMEGISKRDRLRLKRVEPSVRVEMVRLVRLQRQPQSTRTLSQRAELNERAWAQLLSEAKKNDAIRHRRW